MGATAGRAQGAVRPALDRPYGSVGTIADAQDDLLLSLEDLEVTTAVLRSVTADHPVRPPGTVPVGPPDRRRRARVPQA